MSRMVGLLIVAAAVLPGVCHGIVLPQFDFGSLEEKSDLICVCRVEELREAGRVTKSFQFVRGPVVCTQFEASCEVLASFKGVAEKRLTVKFLRETSFFLGLCTVSQDECGILFLKRDAEGAGYTFAEWRKSKIAMVRYYADSDSPTATVKQRVERQLLAALESAEFSEVANAVYWIKELKSSKGAEAVIRLAEDANVPAPIEAFALELKVPEGRGEVIKDAVAFLEETTAYKGRARWRLGLVAAFAKIKRTDDVQLLNELLVTGPTQVARLLASCSPHWADATSIPYLIGALERLDRGVWYPCIASLVRLTRRGWPGPGRREFMADPEKYILDWQEWWGAGEPAALTGSGGIELADRNEAFWSWPCFLIGVMAGLAIGTLSVLLKGKARATDK